MKISKRQWGDLTPGEAAGLAFCLGAALSLAYSESFLADIFQRGR